METLKAKWQEMGLYRRILLAVMLAEIVGFLIAYVIVVNRPGLEYSGALLYPHTEGELQIYEGKIDGEPARFAVSPEGEISYQWGSTLTAPGRWWRTRPPCRRDYSPTTGSGGSAWRSPETARCCSGAAT